MKWKYSSRFDKKVINMSKVTYNNKKMSSLILNHDFYFLFKSI